MHDMLEMRGCGLEAELHTLGHKHPVLRGQPTVALQVTSNGNVMKARLDIKGGHDRQAAYSVKPSLAVR